MADWLITIPQQITWEAYQRELDVVKKEHCVTFLNYKVPFIPREFRRGDRCFVVWRGQVRGWMICWDSFKADKPWACETSGTWWGAGSYIQRYGEFYALKDGEAIKGFQGIRRYRLPRERAAYAAASRAMDAGKGIGRWQECLTPEEIEFLRVTPGFRVMWSRSYHTHLGIDFDFHEGSWQRKPGQLLCGAQVKQPFFERDPGMWSVCCDNCVETALALDLPGKHPDALSGIGFYLSTKLARRMRAQKEGACP